MDSRELCQASQGEAHVWSRAGEKWVGRFMAAMVERKLSCCCPQICEVSIWATTCPEPVPLLWLHQSAHGTEMPCSAALRPPSTALRKCTPYCHQC